jgi:hypothetical protein
VITFILGVAYWLDKQASVPHPVLSADVLQWKTYKNTQYGFEIKYPPDWFVIENPNNSSITFSNVQSLSFPGSFMPLIFQGDPFKNEAVFSLYMHKVMGGPKPTDQQYIEDLKRNDPLQRQYSIGEIGGKIAVKAIATSRDAYQEYFTENGTYSFQISFRTQQPKFDNYYPYMLDSLRFTPIDTLTN